MGVVARPRRRPWTDVEARTRVSQSTILNAKTKIRDESVEGERLVPQTSGATARTQSRTQAQRPSRRSAEQAETAVQETVARARGHRAERRCRCRRSLEL